MNESNSYNAINFPVTACFCLIMWWIMTFCWEVAVYDGREWRWIFLSLGNGRALSRSKLSHPCQILDWNVVYSVTQHYWIRIHRRRQGGAHGIGQDCNRCFCFLCWNSNFQKAGNWCLMSPCAAPAAGGDDIYNPKV